MTSSSWNRRPIRPPARPNALPVVKPAKSRNKRSELGIESLEDRAMLAGPGLPTAADHIHARLNIFVNGQRVVIPADVGTTISHSATPGPGAYMTPVHTHDNTGKLHIEPSLATIPLSPAGRLAKVGDFFDAWRIYGGNAGQNPNAIFNANNLMGNVADATHVVRMFVNGVASTEFENYIFHDNDEITLLYDTITAGTAGTAPVLMPIDTYYNMSSTGAVDTANVVKLLAGSPLYVPLDGYDPNGGPITYTFSSDNPNVTGYIPTNNRSMRISVAGQGTMTFQLFEDLAPRATSHMIQLANSNFFDGVTFHRIINNFVIQGGDPTGTGSGGSNLGDFDDQFNVDLQHNRTGLLSMAKSSDDTNDSQFFITDTATRSLDFNHTIFGMLTQGDYLRDVINAVPTDSSDKPTTPVVMEDVSIFTDLENNVLRLKAAAGFVGSANITVTARDSNGNTQTRTFAVNVTADTQNGGPFLNELTNNFTTAPATPVSGTLTSTDVESDPVYYDFQPTPANGGWTFTLDNTNGNWTFTPQAGKAGIFSQLVGVRPVTASNTGQGFDYDIEEFLFNVNAPSQAAVGQAYSIDIQTPEELFTTKPTGFQYSLANAPAGMTINATTGALTWTPAANQTGTFNFEVKTTDTDANQGEPRTFAMSVTVPGAVTVPTGVDLSAASDSGTNNSDNITNVTQPQIVVNGVTSGAVVRLYDGNTVIGQATASGTSVTITPTSALASGAHVLSATMQTTGSEGGKSPTLSITIDNTAPPAITPAFPATGSINTAISYNAENAEEGQAGFAYSLSGAPTGMTINATSGAVTWTPTASQTGSHSFEIRATDVAGNVRTLAATINIGGGAPSGVDLLDASDAGFSNSDNITNATQPQFQINGVTSGAVVKLYDGTTFIGQATASGTSVTITPTSALAAGVHSISATQTIGAATESSKSTALSVTIDTTAPPLFAVSPPSSAGIGVLYTFDVANNEEGQTGFRYSLVTPPTGMTINDTTGVITWTPTSTQSGSHNFTLRATDIAGNQRNLAVTITVAGGAPTSVDLNAVSDSGMSNVDNLTNETLPQFTINGVTAGATVRVYDGATLLGTVAASGTTATFQPGTPLSSGVHSISASQVVSGVESAKSTALSITIDTTAPGAITPNFPSSALVGTAVSYNAANAEEGQAGFSYSLNNAPSGMTINASTGVITWTPTAAQVGVRTFEIRATDAAGNIRALPSSVTVAGALAGGADSYNTNEDTALTVTAVNGVLANDGDQQAGALTASLITNVAHGALTLNSNGSFTYTPAANYNGSDSFTYQATDGTRTTAPVTVTINVASINDLPVAVADSYQVTEDTALTVPVATGVLSNDTDADGTLTAQLVANVAHGVLTLNANGSFTYTPAANYSGSDSFTYRANDGTANSSTVTVTLTVAATNDAPTAVADSYNLSEDQALTIAAAQGVLNNDTDPEGSTLTASVVTSPTHGTLTLNANGSFVYTPAANYNGTDSFTYRVSDGASNSAPVTVSLTIAAVNDVPVATADSYAIISTGALNVTAANGVLKNDTDADGTTLTAELVTGPAHGTLTLNANGSFTYTPASGFSGSDSFTYRATDGTTPSAPATVTIGVNGAPVGVADQFSVDEDQALTVAAANGVLHNDTDNENDPLTAELVSGPAHGLLTLNPNGGFVYTPAANYNGPDSFTYRARDAQQSSAAVTVSLTVNSVNDAPTATAEQYRVNKNGTLTVDAAQGVLINDADLEGASLIANIATGPAHGILTLNPNGSFTYTPTAGYSGSDSFTYRASDGVDQSPATTVTLVVNSAPTGVADTYQASEDTPLTVMPADGVLHNDTDLESDTLTAALVTGPTHGALTLNPNGTFTYTPAANFAGSDSFTYRANDGALDSAPVTVTINVANVNDAPIAGNDSIETNEDTSLTVDAAHGVLANDSDPEGTPITAVLVAAPAHGTVTLNANGSFTYSPAPNYFGADSFTYRALDGQVASNIATVSVNVKPLADPPVFSPVASKSILAGGTVTYDFDATDIDGNAQPLVYSIESAPAGAAINPTTGLLTWTAPNDADGRFPIVVRATKGSVDALFSLVTLNVDVTQIGGLIADVINSTPRVLAFPPTGRPLRAAPPDRPRSGNGGNGSTDNPLRVTRNPIARIQSGGDLRVETGGENPEDQNKKPASTPAAGGAASGAAGKSDTSYEQLPASLDSALASLDLSIADRVASDEIAALRPAAGKASARNASAKKTAGAQPKQAPSASSISRADLAALKNFSLRDRVMPMPNSPLAKQVAQTAPAADGATNPVGESPRSVQAASEKPSAASPGKTLLAAAAASTMFAPLLVTQIDRRRKVREDASRPAIRPAPAGPKYR